MPVGKGSLVRASKVSTNKAEPVKTEEEVKAEKLFTEEKTAAIHKNKFEAVSNIKSDLPVYLL